jgi:hypothetical protein
MELGLTWAAGNHPLHEIGNRLVHRAPFASAALSVGTPPDPVKVVTSQHGHRRRVDTGSGQSKRLAEEVAHLAHGSSSDDAVRFAGLLPGAA